MCLGAGVFVDSRLTVGEASRHAGRGERVALLRVDELAHRRQLVHFSVSRGAGPVGSRGLHWISGAGERRGDAPLATPSESEYESSSHGILPRDYCVFVSFFNDRKKIRFQQEKVFIPFYYIMTEERAEASRRS